MRELWHGPPWALPFTLTVTQPIFGPLPETNSYCSRPSCQPSSYTLTLTQVLSPLLDLRTGGQSFTERGGRQVHLLPHNDTTLLGTTHHLRASGHSLGRWTCHI